MNIWKEYVLPVVSVAFFIGGLVVARMTRHRPYDLTQGLSVCTMCAGCFAGGFVRAGWDKAAVAFLFIFVPTSIIAIGRWSVHRRYQSTLPQQEPPEKVPS